jgi:plasmid stability protein
MAQIIIRNLDDALLVRLKRKAWENGLPLEESLRRFIIAGLEAEERQSDEFFAPESSGPDLSRGSSRTEERFHC